MLQVVVVVVVDIQPFLHFLWGIHFPLKQTSFG